MKFLWGVVISIGLFAVKDSGAFEYPASRTGYIFPLGETQGAVLFTIKTEYQPKAGANALGQFQTHSIITDQKAEKVLTEDADVSDGQIVSQRVIQYQLDHEYTVTVTNGKVKFTDQDIAHQKTAKRDEVDWTADFVTGPITEWFIDAHWDELMRGDTVHCRFGVLESLDTYGFNFSLKKKGTFKGHEIATIAMRPRSLFNSMMFSLMGGEMQLDLDLKTHRVVHYLGLTPLQRADSKGKLHHFSAEIIYE